MRTLLVLLNPFAPHVSSELWQLIGAPGEITDQSWPAYDENLLTEEEVEIVLQINGKVKGHITMPTTATDKELEASALEYPKIQEALSGKLVRKVVVVPKKLVNIVAG
jgi:leucyl-tRNA synthetase